MSLDAQALTRAGKLVFRAILLSILVAILFGSFSLVLPPHQWTVWRVPILIAAAGAVALMIAGPSYSTMRPWVMDGLAAVLSLASAISGIGITLLFAYGLELQIAEYRGSVDSFIYQMTNPMARLVPSVLCDNPRLPGACRPVDCSQAIAGGGARVAGRHGLPVLEAWLGTFGDARGDDSGRGPLPAGNVAMNTSAEAPLADLFQQLVGADDRAGTFCNRLVARGLLLLGPAQESARILMSPQQLLDTRTQGRVGPACLVEKAPELVGALAVQGFEKDRLGIGLCVAHGWSPIVFRYSMPRFRRNPPGNLGIVNRRSGRRPDADGHKARREHRTIDALRCAGIARGRRRHRAG